MMLPACSCSIAGADDICRVIRISAGCTAVDATVPIASQVSVFVDDRFRKSMSVCLKKFGVLVLNVVVAERLCGLVACVLKRLSAADGIGAPKSKVCAPRVPALSAVTMTRDSSVV